MTARRVRLVVVAVVALLFSLAGLGGSSLASTATTSPGLNLTWHARVDIDPDHGGPTAVSCASSTECIAGDETGATFRGNGKAWTMFPRWSEKGSIDSISCPTTTFCAAAVAGQSVEFLENGAWKATSETGTVGEEISCASATFCVAASPYSSYAEVYSGSKWTSTSQYSGVSTISCPKVNWCAGFDTDGDAYVLAGHTWSVPVGVFGDDTDENVSCVSDAYCVATDDGEISVFNGTEWTSPAYISADPEPMVVSCYAVQGCIAADTDETQSYRLLPSGSWTSLTGGVERAAALSCLSASFCEAVGKSGESALYDGTSWTTQTFDPIDNGSIWAISCATSTFCVALDDDGFATSFDGKTWSTPEQVDTHGSVDDTAALSCRTAAFCMAVTGSNRAFAYNGKTWSPPMYVRAQELNAVSCASATFCAAISNTDVFVYDGHSWSEGTRIDTMQSPEGPVLTGISCPTSTMCEAINSVGNAFAYNGTSWSKTQVASSYLSAGAISCGSARSCTVAVGNGSIAHFNGRTWAKPVRIDKNPDLTAVSCVSANRCVVVDSKGDAIRLYQQKPVQVTSVASRASLMLSCATTHLCIAVINQTFVREAT